MKQGLAAADFTAKIDAINNNYWDGVCNRATDIVNNYLDILDAKIENHYKDGLTKIDSMTEVFYYPEDGDIAELCVSEFRKRGFNIETYDGYLKINLI